MTAGYRGRFAPSPTGDLHLGGARTALVAWLAARAAGGAYVVRVEDLDGPRVVPGADERILEDLRWLGLDWDEGPDVGGPHAPYRQSLRLARYDAAVEQLLADGRAFRCWCSRAEVARAAAAPHGPADDGPRYPGTCRVRTTPAAARSPPVGAAARRARRRSRSSTACTARTPKMWPPPSATSSFAAPTASPPISSPSSSTTRPWASATSCAATICSARPRASSCSIARSACHAPRFAHVPLVLGPDGARLSKRHGAIGVRALRERGRSAADVVGLLASTLGLCPAGTSLSARELVADFTLSRITRAPTTLDPETL